MYKFRMSIGDWSDDGHGKHEDFIVSSNAPVEVVREAHYSMEAATGINIEDICADYEESEMDIRTYDTLIQMGFKFEGHDAGDGTYLSPEEMAHIWLFLLMKSNPTLRLELAEDEVPTFHFYGYDDKGRHIGQVGYGLFE